jgi:hypothetical protein
MPDFSTLYSLQTVNNVLLDGNAEINGIKAKRKKGWGKRKIDELDN